MRRLTKSTRLFTSRSSSWRNRWTIRLRGTQRQPCRQRIDAEVMCWSRTWRRSRRDRGRRGSGSAPRHRREVLFSAYKRTHRKRATQRRQPVREEAGLVGGAICRHGDGGEASHGAQRHDYGGTLVGGYGLIAKAAPGARRLHAFEDSQSCGETGSESVKGDAGLVLHFFSPATAQRSRFQREARGKGETPLRPPPS